MLTASRPRKGRQSRHCRPALAGRTSRSSRVVPGGYKRFKTARRIKQLVSRRVQILLMVCLAAAADTGAQTDTWRQCFADKPEAAVEACSDIIFLNPRHDGAFINRGIAYRRL